MQHTLHFRRIQLQLNVYFPAEYSLEAMFIIKQFKKTTQCSFLGVVCRVGEHQNHWHIDVYDENFHTSI